MILWTVICSFTVSNETANECFFGILRKQFILQSREKLLKVAHHNITSISIILQSKHHAACHCSALASPALKQTMLMTH